MANRRFTQFFQTLHNKPVLLDCNFTVSSTDSAGYGITGLKGPGIQNVYMHTSATPAVGSPNPALGYAMVQFQDNYNGYFGGFSGFVSPLSGSDISSGMTVGVPYVISVLGNTTLAQWRTAGLPVGITPAVGAAFVAAATSVAGTGKVQLALNSGVGSIEVVGTPNKTIVSNAANVPGLSSGSYIILQFLKDAVTMSSYTPAGTNSAPALTMNSYTPAGTNANDGPPETFTGTPAVLTGSVAAPVFTGTPAVLTGAMSKVVGNPANGSVVNLSFYFSNSSIIVKGE